MPYCLNCDYAHNPHGDLYCQKCGALLALRGRFNIVRQIGEGGFGKTYLAADLDNRDKPCVVKQLVHQGTNTVAAQESQRLFEQEAERLDQLNHSQIPQLLAYFEQGHYLYLVQEFIEGHDLQAELRQQGPFSEDQIWEILRELLPILEFIHGHHVIHRDLKPENVMRRECDRKLFLIDFGVAKRLAETTKMDGTVVGTPGYAPPEQMQGRVSPASDLFSLGMICFHLLTQKSVYQLFQDHNYTWVDHWQQHLNVPISQRLETVLGKLLKWDENERYLTADDVLNDVNGDTAVVRDTKKESPAIHSFSRTVRPERTSLQKRTEWFSKPGYKWLMLLGVLGGGVVSLGFLLRSQPTTWHSKIATSPSSVEAEVSIARQPVADASVPLYADSFAQVTQVPTGIFNYGGSTTWSPIRDSVDVEIQTARPEFRLRYVPPEEVPPSSQAGLDMLVQGKVDFSLASRLPSNELLEALAEKGINIRLVPVAENFDVAAVNLALPVDQLTIDQLNAILEGRILNWREVGGPDLDITRFDRDVNENFMDTRPNLESDNIKLFTTPSEAVRTSPDFPGGIYVHTAAMLVPQCLMKTLTLVNGEGQSIMPYKEPLVAVEQCPIQKNKVNLAELGSDKYPRQLRDTLYVVINQNGEDEQRVGEAYAGFLLSEEGQALLEQAGYLRIRR